MPPTDPNVAISTAPAAAPSGSPPLGAPPPPPAPSSPPAAAAATPAAPEPQTVTHPDGRIQILGPQGYKRLRETERRKGRTEAVSEFDEMARAAGFRSAQEALANMLRSARGGQPPRPRRDGGQPPRQAAPPSGGSEAAPPGAPPAVPANRHDRKAWEKYQRAVEAHRRQLDDFRRQLADEKQRRRDLQHEADARDAEMALRETAIGVGVRDVKYAIHLFKERCSGMSEEELTKFDEAGFFGGLRKTHPYLFGETSVPANTGTGGGAPPPPAPAPGPAAAAAAKAGQFDARSVPVKEVNERLRRMGINPLGM